jgi:hypothetical protein
MIGFSGAHMNSEDRDLARDVIIAELNYIAQTAFQANEDRARVSSVYTTAVASLIAAVLSSQIRTTGTDQETIAIYIGFAIIFSIISVFGFLTIFQLIRLRLAWRESAHAMNLIKEYAVSNFESAKSAFLWTESTLPPAFKTNSISFISVLQVAIVGGVMFGASIMSIGFIFSGWWWIPACMSGFLYCVLQVAVYWLSLRS